MREGRRRQGDMTGEGGERGVGGGAKREGERGWEDEREEEKRLERQGLRREVRGGESEGR